MVRVADIHSLTSFLRDHKSHLDRLAETGRPEVLTVNGKARIVVQDAEAYEKLLDLLDAADAERTLRERLAEVDRGEPGVPAADALARARVKGRRA